MWQDLRILNARLPSVIACDRTNYLPDEEVTLQNDVKKAYSLVIRYCSSVT